MKLFKCTRCGQLLYFENRTCERCGHALGFESDALNLFTLQLQEDNSYKIYNQPHSENYVYCINATYGVCNWLVPVTRPGGFCRACELNRMIPNLSKPEYIQRWQVLESAKHRLVYSLLRMNLPLASKAKNPEGGLYFDFLADEKINTARRILTGHNQGLITINIAEADDIEREMARRAMAEVYRTVLGHFRHEIGHYYWDRLMQDTVHLQHFRKLFGDERANYAEALKRHYRDGPPKQWDQQFISAYATMHPWEDWAETWAHYLHIMDTLETAYAFGVAVKPAVAETWASLHAEISTDPYDLPELGGIINLWLPLTFTMNSLNRSMGLRDPYPFLIRPKIMEKMKFIHDICYEARSVNSQRVTQNG